MPKTYQKDVHFNGSKIWNLLGLALQDTSTDLVHFAGQSTGYGQIPPCCWRLVSWCHSLGHQSVATLCITFPPAKINPRYEGQYLDDMQHGYGVAMYVTTLEAVGHLVTTSNFLQWGGRLQVHWKLLVWQASWWWSRGRNCQPVTFSVSWRIFARWKTLEFVWICQVWPDGKRFQGTYHQGMKHGGSPSGGSPLVTDGDGSAAQFFVRTVGMGMG